MGLNDALAWRKAIKLWLLAHRLVAPRLGCIATAIAPAHAAFLLSETERSLLAGYQSGRADEEHNPGAR